MKKAPDNKSEDNRPLLKLNFYGSLFSSFLLWEASFIYLERSWTKAWRTGHLCFGLYLIYSSVNIFSTCITHKKICFWAYIEKTWLWMLRTRYHNFWSVTIFAWVLPYFKQELSSEICREVSSSSRQSVICERCRVVLIKIILCQSILQMKMIREGLKKKFMPVGPCCLWACFGVLVEE